MVRCDSSYGITDAAANFLTVNDFISIATPFTVQYTRNDDGTFIRFEYNFEPAEKTFYDFEKEYFNIYTNDTGRVVREYSQVLFFSSGACEFVALEEFDFDEDVWVPVEESLWSESDVPVGDYSPSYNPETGLFCRD